jgi:hypothetical protein
MPATRDHEFTKKVYACKSCWKDTWRTRKWLENTFTRVKHSQSMCPLCPNCNNELFSFTDIEIFDSQAEHAYGLNVLKPLEKAGEITDLQHHEVFELLPVLHFTKMLFRNTIEIDGLYNKSIGRLSKINTTKYPAEFKTHNSIKYESDFTYKSKGEKIVVEYKGEDQKIIVKMLTDAITREKIKQKIKIPWPYFPKSQPEKHFKLKCQLMKSICKLDVQVQAGKYLFRYNEKWQLKEMKA